MPTRHDLLIRSAARLYSLGVDVEGAREKLRELVNKKGSYESPEMREALRNFQELDAQFKALEKDHLELRPERGAQPLRNAGRSTAGDWGRKPPASKADQCAVRAGLPCLPNVKTTIIQTGVNLPIYFAEYSILRNNSHGLIIQNYSICSQMLQGKDENTADFWHPANGDARKRTLFDALQASLLVSRSQLDSQKPLCIRVANIKKEDLKMAKGENIFKRKDGRWEARYIKGYELSGKIKYGFCYGKTYKEAKEKVEKYKAALVSGNPCLERVSKHRFGFYCDEWLRTCKSRIKESTYVKYSTTLERHFKSKLGGCFPAAITAGLVEAFSDELLYEDGLSPKTVKDILVTLRSVLKYTAKQLPGVLPVIDITYPKEPKNEMRVLSRTEQARFVAYLLKDMDECKLGILLALYTGIRIGELCALKWDMVSLKEMTIRITSTMQRLRDLEMTAQQKTKIVIGSPKSDSSWRIIPLTDYTTELCRKMKPQNQSAYILTGTSSHMEPRTLQYRLEKYTKECELDDVHFHTFRHTFATRCVEVGFEIKSLSEILGHSTTTITLDRYVHSSIDLKRNNMNKLTAAEF